ncbi:hypothetical protein, partial [Mariniluteicoccus endophyticus]
ATPSMPSTGTPDVGSPSIGNPSIGNPSIGNPTVSSQSKLEMDAQAWDQLAQKIAATSKALALPVQAEQAGRLANMCRTIEESQKQNDKWLGQGSSEFGRIADTLRTNAKQFAATEDQNAQEAVSTRRTMGGGPGRMIAV